MAVGEGQSHAGIAALDGFTELGHRRLPGPGSSCSGSTTLRAASRDGLFEGRGPIAIVVLIVLVGGLALNLTPCVLPMIPFNLAIIGAGAQADPQGEDSSSARPTARDGPRLRRARSRVILTAGTFGTIYASPWFNAGIAFLFVVLGLAISTSS